MFLVKKKHAPVERFSSKSWLAQLNDADGVDLNEIKNDLITYLTKLSLRFKEYFPEVERSTYQWIMNPFLCDLTDIPDSVNGFAEQMIELRSICQCEMLLDERKDNLESFWVRIHDEYLVVAEEAIVQLLPFLSTNMCEVGIFTVAFIKKRNCLVNAEYDMRYTYIHTYIYGVLYECALAQIGISKIITTDNEALAFNIPLLCRCKCGEDATETLALVYKPVQKDSKRVLGIACQGTIVPGKHQNHTDTVLVSSYCIVEDPQEGYVVSVGSPDPHGDLQSSAQKFRAQRILNFPFEQHPVGILKTPQPIMYSDTVKPMCIADVPLPDEHACILGVLTQGGLMTLRHMQMLYESDCEPLAEGLSSYLCGKVKEIDADVGETFGLDPSMDIYPFVTPLEFNINGVKPGSLETPLFCLTNKHPTWSVYGFTLNAYNVTDPESPILFSDVSTMMENYAGRFYVKNY
ncbi:Uncharacterized protein T11_14155 [Trichinella zimbabwensis]|uniref:Peptidase S1 domain-containing protein n=1 Tax=Trichinella zimbabwensis TaxID=268475 RepID=A0A0V1HFI2_9BILA|nr:Uncharacterized protein T11_14155 [Trichinella zimbabwensis]